ncbi:MAG: hypothetical protein AAB483_03725 [Patescibacteria group bacterium]
MDYLDSYRNYLRFGSEDYEESISRSHVMDLISKIEVRETADRFTATPILALPPFIEISLRDGDGTSCQGDFVTDVDDDAGRGLIRRPYLIAPSKTLVFWAVQDFFSFRWLHLFFPQALQ